MIAKISFSDVLSVLAFLFSIMSFYVYDRRLKKLQEKNAERENIAFKQAMPFIETFRQMGQTRNPHGEHIMVLKNVGLAVAHNLHWEFVEEVPLLYEMQRGNIELLHPNQEIRRRYLLTCNQKASVKVKFCWDDDFASRRTMEQIIDLCND